jgi:hypothetical protein
MTSVGSPVASAAVAGAGDSRRTEPDDDVQESCDSSTDEFDLDNDGVEGLGVIVLQGVQVGEVGRDDEERGSSVGVIPPPNRSRRRHPAKRRPWTMT